MVEEAPVIEEELVVEEAPEVEETPVAEEASVTEEAPMIEEAFPVDETIEFDDYETPLGFSDEIAEPAYEYERGEDGSLILDNRGNPIAIVAEGEEIPVTYGKDTEGQLVLDEAGDPVVTKTVPADSVIISSLEDALNPDRAIDIYYSWNNEEPAFGGEVTFTAVLYGYENLEYNVQWQQSKDCAEWFDLQDACELDYSNIITPDNYMDYWRVLVTVTGIAE